MTALADWGYEAKIEYRMRIEVTDPNTGEVVYSDYSATQDTEVGLANWRLRFERTQHPGGQRRIWREARTVSAWAEA